MLYNLSNLSEQQMNQIRFAQGWNKDFLQFVDYALEHGSYPNSSMGSTISMPLLAPYRRMFADYLRQKFYQLERPPFDFITDRQMMDMSVTLNDKKFESAVLRPEELIEETSNATINLGNRATSYKNHISLICYKAITFGKKGEDVIILNDEIEPGDVPAIDMPIAIRAVRKALDKAELENIKIVAQTGQVQTPHHLAVLIGCGASAVYPYLLYQYGEQRGDITKLVTALEDGLLRAVSRAGLKSIGEYTGAFCFETIGIDGRDEFLSELFGTSSWDIGGFRLENLERDFTTDVTDLPEFGLFKSSLAELSADRKLISREFIEGLQKGGNVEKLYDAENIRLQHAPVAIRHLFEFKEQMATSSPPNLRPYLDAFQIAGMAYGAIKSPAHKLLAQVANELGIQMSTGAGPAVVDGIRTAQLATGRYGVNADFLLNAEVVEIKIAQGANPGDVGQFPAARVDVDMAVTRNSLPNTILPNPARHYDVQNINDIAGQVNELRNLFAGAGKEVRIAVKFVASCGIGELAVKLAERGVDIIKITGDNGGTMNSPTMSVYHSGMPTELGVREVHVKLTEAGLRTTTQIIQSGDANTPYDIAFAYLNGADAVESGKGALIHLAGCEMHAQCGDCPKGITSNPDKFKGEVGIAKANLINLLTATAEILANLGFESPQAAIGKLHEIAQLRSIRELENAGIPLAANLNMELFLTPSRPALPREKQNVFSPNLEVSFGSKLAGETYNYLSTTKYDSLSKAPVISRGNRGDGYAAYLNGREVSNMGDVGKFAGKFMSAGAMNISGSVSDYALYGCSGGKVNITGNANRYFMVGNSGSDVVIGGNVGTDAFREMRRGSAIILGSVGADAFKGYFGGIVAVYDPDDKFVKSSPNGKIYSLQSLNNSPLLKASMQRLIIRRLQEFSSSVEVNASLVVQTIIQNPEAHLPHFKIAIPNGMRLNMEAEQAEDLAKVFIIKPPTVIEQLVFNIITHNISFRKINIRPFAEDDRAETLGLTLTPEQEPYVGGKTDVILAGLKPNQQPYVIINNSKIVGFYILDQEFSEKEKQEITSQPNEVVLRKFFIDYRQQGKGFAAEALKCMFRDTRKFNPEAERIALTVNCKNQGAARQYIKAGFVQESNTYLGGTKGPQYVMRIDLPLEVYKQSEIDWRNEVGINQHRIVKGPSF